MLRILGDIQQGDFGFIHSEVLPYSQLLLDIQGLEELDFSCAMQQQELSWQRIQIQTKLVELRSALVRKVPMEQKVVVKREKVVKEQAKLSRADILMILDSMEEEEV